MHCTRKHNMSTMIAKRRETLAVLQFPGKPASPLDCCILIPLLLWSFLSYHLTAGSALEGMAKPDFHIRHPVYLFNCSNIPAITISEVLHRGQYIHTLRGNYGSKFVLVKMVTMEAEDVHSCMKEMTPLFGGASDKINAKCSSFSNMKLMKEILMLQQLEHPNLISLIGFCVQGEDAVSKSLDKHGIIAVYEYARPFVAEDVSFWPLTHRIEAAIGLCDLLTYLDNTPLGSVSLGEHLSPDDFFVKGNTFKLVNFEGLTASQPQSLCQYGSVHAVPETKSWIVSIFKLSLGSKVPTSLRNIPCDNKSKYSKQNLSNIQKVLFRILLYEAVDLQVEIPNARWEVARNAMREAATDSNLTLSDLRGLLTELLSLFSSH